MPKENAEYNDLQERQLRMLREAFDSLFVKDLFDKQNEMSKNVINEVGTINNSLGHLKFFVEDKSITDKKQITKMNEELEGIKSELSNIEDLKKEINAMKEKLRDLVKTKELDVLERRIKHVSVLLYIVFALSFVLLILLYTK